MDLGDLSTIPVLLSRAETQIGVVVGILALGATVWIWRVQGGRRPELAGSAGTYGAAWVLAAVIALAVARGLPVAVAVAVAVAGGTAGRLWRPVALAAVAVAGLWLALTIPGGGIAERLAVGVSLPIAVAAASWWPRQGGGRLLPVLLAVTALGQVAVLPDVEEVLAVAAVAGAMSLAVLPPVRAGLGAAGAAAATTLLVWTAGAGGYGRPSAVVGGLAAFGLVLAVPAGLAVVGWRRSSAGRGAITATLIAHMAVVVVVARDAGMRDGAATAWLVAGAVLALSVVLTALVGATARAKGGNGAPHDGS